MPEFTEADRVTVEGFAYLVDYATMPEIRKRAGGEADTTMALVDEIARLREALAEVIGIVKRSGGS